MLKFSILSWLEEVKGMHVVCYIVGAAALMLLGALAAVIFIRKTDSIRSQQSVAPPPPQPDPVPQPMPGSTFYVTALSGPLRGQSCPVGQDGLRFGCDPSCDVRFPPGTPGVSRQHCCICWQQGVPMLMDLNSTYGTFMGDGRKLPPRSPARLAAGSRFYLGAPNCLFQLVLPDGQTRA